MSIKEWFLLKNFSQNERYIIKCAALGGELSTDKETEKAYHFVAESDYGTFRFWCPKSCVCTEEQGADAVLENSGLCYNKRLVEFLKSAGIKGVRTGLKTSTLLKKIRENGLEAPAY